MPVSLTAVAFLSSASACSAQTRIQGVLTGDDGQPLRPDRVWAVVDVPDEDGPPGTMILAPEEGYQPTLPFSPAETVL